MCSWGGIRVRFPGTVSCIVHTVHPPDGRQIERPRVVVRFQEKASDLSIFQSLEISSVVQIASGQ